MSGKRNYYLVIKSSRRGGFRKDIRLDLKGLSRGSTRGSRTISIRLPEPGRYESFVKVTKHKGKSAFSKAVFFTIAASEEVLPTSVPTVIVAVENTPLPSATSTATPSATFTATSTATVTPSPTATFTPTHTATSTPTNTATATLTPTPTFTVTSTPTVTPTVIPAACGNDAEISSQYGYGALYANEPITDLTIGTPVADLALQANLQSAIVMPSTPSRSSCNLRLPLPYGCYSVEFLFTEMADCVTSLNQRSFLVSAPELGVSNAEVNIMQQLGGANLFYPGAYTASGPVLDGELNINFEQKTLNPIISGFNVTTLNGCSIPTPRPGTPTPSFANKSIDLDGSTILPEGIIYACATATPTPSPTPI